MEGVLSSEVKRIVFSGNGFNTKKQNNAVYKNIIIEEDTLISEADVKFNNWMEKVQEQLAKLRKRKLTTAQKELAREENKKRKDEDKIEDLEDNLEELEEWNVVLDIVSVQSSFYGPTKTIEVTYRITEYMIDN